MSDRDDFDFEDDPFGDDPFGDEGFDDFDDFGDDLGDDDFESGLGFDDEQPGDFEDFPEDEGTAATPGGVSRPFLFIAAALIIVFLLGIGLVVFLVLGQGGPSDLELTATSIVETNAAIEILANQTATESFFIGQTETAIANFTDTPTPTATFTATPTATSTATPDATEQALLQLTLDAEAALIAQQTADAQATLDEAARLTEIAMTPTEPAFSGTNVAETATALALTLAPPEVTEDVDPGPGATAVVALPTELPDGGLFDDVSGNRGNLGVIALMAFGLVGVIVASRRLRR